MGGSATAGGGLFLSSEREATFANTFNCPVMRGWT
jgi:hypothetical protein